jgi:hypothetical protein
MVIALWCFHVPLWVSIREIRRMSCLNNYLGSYTNYFYADCSRLQVAVTDAMIRMDTLGLGPTEVWADSSDKYLIGVLRILLNN